MMYASATAASILDRVDPRVRIIAAIVFTLAVTVAGRTATLVTSLAVAGVAAGLAGLTLKEVARRLAPLNLFMLLLVLIVPLSTEGAPLAAIGPLRYSREGFLLSIAVALKGNAVVLAMIALVGTMDIMVLGHTLHHLYLPDKLIHHMLFTVRYLEVLRREYGRLAGAMKARGFRPRMNRHTYRAYGHLVGMLLVRSLDRSERIVAAMKCRGFRGRFYLLDHFAVTRRDGYFAVIAAAVLFVLAVMECA